MDYLVEEEMELRNSGKCPSLGLVAGSELLLPGNEASALSFTPGPLASAHVDHLDEKCADFTQL